MRDPDEFGVAVSGASLLADFLAPQTLPTQVEQFQSSGWALDFHEAHVNARVQATLPPGWASLGLMRGHATSTWHGFAGRRGVLVCTPPGETIDGVISPGFQCMSVNVPSAVWEQCQALSGTRRSAFGGVVAHQLSSSNYIRIEQKLCEVRELLRRASAAPQFTAVAAHEAAALAEQIVTIAWELGEPSGPPRDSLRNRTRLARRAEAWMRGHLSEPLRIADVCLALRVSRRELEYAFRLTLDISPQEFLRNLRLNAIRRALRRAGCRSDTISRIATEHGVTHLGRFAAHYRALFGERPCETLRQ